MQTERTSILEERVANLDSINPPTLQNLFGQTAVARVLDFLTLYREFDYPLTEIAENSGVAWKTLHKVWPNLEKYGVVKLTREIGRAKLYKLNTESEIARTLTQLGLQIAKHDTDRIFKEKKATH